MQLLMMFILASSIVSASIISHTWDTEPQFIAGSSIGPVQLNLNWEGVCDAKRYFFDIRGYYYPILGTDTGTCRGCDGYGAERMPVDDSACGNIDCDLLDDNYPSGAPSVTGTNYCRYKKV